MEFFKILLAHHLGGNQNERDKFKGHKYFNDTVNFCEKMGSKIFDPDYKSLSLKKKNLNHTLKKIFSRKPYSN